MDEQHAILKQSISSMIEATDKLKKAKDEENEEEFEKLKEFILNMHNYIKTKI